jgi:hypothetical protein
VDPNTLLDEASPRVAELTPELRSLLDEMVSATRPRSRRTKRRALTAGGLGVGLSLGVVGVAAASVVMHYTFANVPDSTESASFAWRLASGHECTLDVEVGPRPDADPNYSSSQDEALAAARDWMASFEIGSIDVQRAEGEWLRLMQRTQVGRPSAAELSETFSGDELEKYAIVNAATSRLADYLTDRGYDPRSLNSGTGVGCDQ